MPDEKYRVIPVACYGSLDGPNEPKLLESEYMFDSFASAMADAVLRTERQFDSRRAHLLQITRHIYAPTKDLNTLPYNMIVVQRARELLLARGHNLCRVSCI